ncbi:MAG TPA: DinB family protein [Longimicrobiaceae bacterium]|nr:DinB family protein [Longimicrobiaceae bacterium]
MTDLAGQQPELHGARRQLAAAWERECAITLKLLRAYPADQSELQPHPRAKHARDLAWIFALEMALAKMTAHGRLDLSGGFPSAPDSFDEVVSRFESGQRELVEAIRGSTDEELAGTVRFYTGPQQMGDIPVVEFLWFLLHDHIHHRGQLSVYLRMAGGKVPSIYGPSADEPWF